MEIDNEFMRIAIEQAKKAVKRDEVPVGAVIVKDGKIIAKAFNRVEKKKQSLYHAEILAIKKACRKLKSWRLDGTTLYVTLEPCAMCAGAIVNARMGKVVFGATEEKSGCAKSLYPVLTKNGLNHTVLVKGGVMTDECSTLLKEYFRTKRTAKKSKLNN